MPASFTSTSSVAPDSLIIRDGMPVNSRSITLISGQNLTRGAVLGRITASGKYTLSLSAAVDGSQTPDLILAEDTDASGGDKTTTAYESGAFNQDKLVLGASHTLASIQEGLRAKNLVLKKVQTTY